MSQRFTFYLHDQSTSGERREALESQGVELSDEAWEAMGRPFYEVALDCEVNGEGHVTILGARPSS